MIRISLYTSHFSLKEVVFSSELLIYFKYNNHTRWETCIGGTKYGYDSNPIKGEIQKPIL